MAKGSRKVTVNAAPSQSKTPGPDPWQTQDDISSLIRPNAIRQDKPRHARALDMMQKTLDHEQSRVKAPRIKTRAVGRKAAVRNLGRR